MPNGPEETRQQIEDIVRRCVRERKVTFSAHRMNGCNQNDRLYVTATPAPEVEIDTGVDLDGLVRQLNGKCRTITVEIEGRLNEYGCTVRLTKTPVLSQNQVVSGQLP